MPRARQAGSGRRGSDTSGMAAAFAAAQKTYAAATPAGGPPYVPPPGQYDAHFSSFREEARKTRDGKRTYYSADLGWTIDSDGDEEGREVSMRCNDMTFKPTKGPNAGKDWNPGMGWLKGAASAVAGEQIDDLEAARDICKESAEAEVPCIIHVKADNRGYAQVAVLELTAAEEEDNAEPSAEAA